MSRVRRLKMVDRDHPKLSVVRQCSLLGISRSSVYSRRAEVDEYKLQYDFVDLSIGRINFLRFEKIQW